MKNTGRPSEALFDDAWARLGKRAFVFKFTDSAEATGLNRRKGITKVKPQPSDRLVTFEGATWYAEIKSTVDPKKFCFSLLRPSQGAYAAQALAAGGRYEVYIHSLHLNAWYAVPYAHIRAVKDSGKASIPWTELEPFRWISPI